MEPVQPSRDDGPPADADEWTDEQWLTWLKASDADLEDADAQAPTLGERAARSSVGQVVGQAMMGLAQAIYGTTDDELIIVAEGDGEPTDDRPFTVRLDFDNPGQSSVVFRHTDGNAD
jgi:kynureninase